MSPGGPVRTEVDGAVGVITIDRTARHNALDEHTACAFADAVTHLHAQPAVRALLVRAAGRHFGVGGDLHGFDIPEPAGAVKRVLGPLHAALRALREDERPVVAAVQGAAAGGSLALALACDVVVLARDARLVPAYAALGASPDCGLSWTLARALGPRRAVEWLLDGSEMTADEARAAGLVRHVVDGVHLQERALSMARHLAALPPQAVALTRRLAWGAPDRSWAGQLAAESEAFAACATTPAFVERVRRRLNERRGERAERARHEC